MKHPLGIACVIVLLPVGALAAAGADAHPPPVTLKTTGPAERQRTPTLHPPVRLLDEGGRPVAETGGPLSLMKSCGACHDTAFIERNNYHAWVGADEATALGAAGSGRPWDFSPGLFGRWEPLLYRRLGPPGDTSPDLGLADWIRIFGARHVGGGPTGPRPAGSAEGAAVPGPPAIDEASGEPRPWDWRASGRVELNCLLCHSRQPDNAARLQMLKEGAFAWAAGATLLGGGLLRRRPDGAGLEWNSEAFGPDGAVSAERLGLGRPRSANCRLCHSRVCRCSDPVLFENSLENWAAETTGTVYSPARMRDSGMNLAGKDALASPWDVHAERLLECADCHHSPNNPAFDRKLEEGSGATHLAFDARRLSQNEFLWRPDHNLAKGHAAQGTVARRLDGTMRDCRDCHRPESGHRFLPFPGTHFMRLSCAACHVPRLMVPARRLSDWSLPSPDGRPRSEHRGIVGPVNDPVSLITGFEPALLEQELPGGGRRLQPHNLIVSWFWVEGEPPRPVPWFRLRQALFDGLAYHPQIVSALDSNGDGRLADDELRLYSPERVEAVAARLQAAGAVRPRLQAELQPFTIGHGVGRAEDAIRRCDECHRPGGRLGRPQLLAEAPPADVMPWPVADSGVRLPGLLQQDAQGRWHYLPPPAPPGLYLHGASRPLLADGPGMVLFGATVLGVALHGALRFWFWRRRRGR